MATINELRAKAQQLFQDARTILQNLDSTTEDRVKAERMFTDANGITASIERLTQIDELTGTQSQRTVQHAQNETRSRDEIRAEQNAALRTFIRAGRNPSREALAAVDQRALTFAANSSVVLPIDVAQPTVALKSSGAVYDIVHKMKTQSGEPIRLPLFNATGDAMVLNSVAVTTTDPSLTSVESQTDICRINPVFLDNALINDTTFDLLDLVQTGFRQSYALSSANFITNGNGSNVQSIVTGNTNTVTSAVSGTVGYGDLLACLAALDPAYQINGVWSFSNTVLATTILNIKDSTGRPLFLPYLDPNSGFAGSLFGYPVKLNPYLPNVAAGSSSIMFGDHNNGYTYREVSPGLTIKVSDIPAFVQDQTVVVGFARVSGNVTDAGTHPLVTLITHA